MIDLDLHNFTPHEIIIEDDSEVTLPEGKRTARIIYEQEFDHSVNGIAAFYNVSGWLKGLPPKKEGTGYIVSGIVFGSIIRDDIYTPNTSPWSVKRRGYGKVVSVKSLLCHPRRVA
jgi:hypothetical protein